MTKVSIIIPLHNAESFISEAVGSCLNQTYNNIEIIIVENGSKDASWEVVKTIKDKRVKCFQIAQSNAAAARNFGYLKSSGDYINFLDADDVISKHKIELQMEALIKAPEGFIASCPWGKFSNIIHEAVFKEQLVWRVKDPVDWCTTSWNGGGMMIPGCWFLPKTLILKAGLWNEDLTLNDDGEFMCRVLLASKGNVFVDKARVYYRQVSNSLSKNNTSFKAANSLLTSFELYEKHVLQKDNSLRVKKSLATNYLTFIYEYYPKFSDLTNIAKARFGNLGIDVLPLVGGNNFMKTSKMFGFYNALRLRQYVRDLKL